MNTDISRPVLRPTVLGGGGMVGSQQRRWENAPGRGEGALPNAHITALAHSKHSTSGPDTGIHTVHPAACLATDQRAKDL